MVGHANSECLFQAIFSYERRHWLHLYPKQRVWLQPFLGTLPPDPFTKSDMLLDPTYTLWSVNYNSPGDKHIDQESIPS